MQTANTEILETTVEAEGAELIAPASDLPVAEELSPKKRGNRGLSGGLKRQENLIGWLYISPMVIGLLVFTLIPIVMSIMSMFYQWNGNANLITSPFNHFQNFKDIFGGEYTKAYWRGLLNTLVFAIQLPVGMILGLFLALGMNRKMKMANAFRVIYYLPGVMSIVAVTIIWQTLFKDDGTLNNVLLNIGLKKVDWFGTSTGIAFVVNILCIWKGVGYTSLMFIAGLQSVSTDQLEAARIDGASNGKILIKIMLPALYPTIFYLLVTGLMGALQMFNEPFILVKNGNGSLYRGWDAMTAVSFVYYAKGLGNYGLAAVGAWVLAVFIFIITAIQLYVDKRRDQD